MHVEVQPWQPVTRWQVVGVVAFTAVVVVLLEAGDPGWTPILDDANLAFHEAGHVFYGLLGSTARLYGGLLGQLTFPLLAMATFWWRRQPAALATVSVWAAQNLFSMARYMADARAKELPLVGGTEHDFEHIFTRWGVLDHDLTVAAWTRGLGWAGIAISLAWLVWRWRRDPAPSSSAPTTRPSGPRRSGRSRGSSTPPP